MTAQPERLHHLLDRARRGVLLPAEGEALAKLVGELGADLHRYEEVVVGDLNEANIRLQRKVARLTPSTEGTRMITYAHRHGAHHYLSTGCLHGEHGYCQGKTGRAGAKKPAECKFCGAGCTCPCHHN